MRRFGSSARLTRRRVGTRWIGLVIVAALAAAGCGDDGGGDSSDTTGPTTTREPVRGGTLTFAAYSAIPGLDPMVALGSGTSGGIQMAAVYDTLLRYDPETRKYTAHMAELPTSNADFTEWTIKLRPGIQFTDGTPLDAEAVRFNFNRHRVGTATMPASRCAEFVACPRSTRSSIVYMALVRDIEVVDATTLRVLLSEGWSTFPFMMASEPGLIASPTALRRCDATQNPSTCEFNLKPVGAGPFMVTSFRPQEAIEMVRNPNYWGGDVYLDGLNFVALGDLGGERTYEAFRNGTVQGAYLRVPAAVARAKSDGATGLTTIDQAGEILLLNMGVSVTCAGGRPEPLCVGQPDGPRPTTPPTARLKVRQAIGAAFDPEQYNQRIYQGQGLVGTSLFHSSFPWDPGVPGPKYDLNRARQLVQEAKAEGWDGNIRVLYTNAPSDVEAGVILEAMLRNAGMNPTVDSGRDSPAQQTIVVSTKDFDISRWGTATGSDDSALWAIGQNLDSQVGTNRVGFNSPAVDKALKDLRVATTDDERTALYKIIAEEYTRLLPWITVTAIQTLQAFAPGVQGMYQSHRNFTYFDKVWIER